MAGLSFDRDGGCRIIFVVDGSRKAVRLGKLKRAPAEVVRKFVSSIEQARKYAVPLDGPTQAWLDTLPDDIAAKLSATGLIECYQPCPLGEWCREYIAHQPDRSVYSVRNLQRAYMTLADWFHAERDMRSISPQEAQEFRAALFGAYGQATAGREVKRAKQLFRSAFLAGRIDADPFAGVKGGGSENRERLHFVSREVINPIIAAAGHRLRLILTLCRYGGLRCPSELMRLRRADLDFAGGRMLIRGKGRDRWCPIFPELIEVLQSVSGEWVIDWTRAPEPNWREPLEDHLRSLKVQPWPRLFQNLRASRETELVEQGYPLHHVAAWLGNSAVIANKHYLTISDEHFKRAAARVESGEKDGPARPCTRAPAYLPSTTCQERPAETQNPLEIQRVSGKRQRSIPPRAVAGDQKLSEHPIILEYRGAPADALRSWWNGLSESEKAMVRSVACRKAG